MSSSVVSRHRATELTILASWTPESGNTTAKSSSPRKLVWHHVTMAAASGRAKPLRCSSAGSPRSPIRKPTRRNSSPQYNASALVAPRELARQAPATAATTATTTMPSSDWDSFFLHLLGDQTDLAAYLSSPMGAPGALLPLDGSTDEAETALLVRQLETLRGGGDSSIHM